MSRNEYDAGWFYGYSPADSLDEDGRVRKIDTRNVVGRFTDHRVIDIPASQAARKSVYKFATILETRVIRAVVGGLEGKDISSQIIRFDPSYASLSLEAIERFPDAWKAYCADRKTEVSQDERDVLGDPEPAKEAVVVPDKKKRGRPKKANAPMQEITG